MNVLKTCALLLLLLLPSTAMSQDIPKAGVQDFKNMIESNRGKVLIINFWATWCAPCLKEMPDLSALDKDNDHIEVIGLAYEEIEADELKAFLGERPVVYPIAILDVYNPPADFATPRGLPLTYLIAPDGKVAKQFLGPVTGREIEAAIAASGGPKAGA